MLAGSEDEYSVLAGKKEDHRALALLAKYLPWGGCFWDIGASVGFFTVLAAKVVGERGLVIAFEPEPASRTKLEQNVAANGLRNVSIVPVALGRERGVSKLAVADSAIAGSHHLVHEDSSGALDHCIAVEVVPGDELRRTATQLLARIPDVIKVDVEGDELDVLGGLSETLSDPQCRTIFCEVHFALLEERGQPYGPVEAERLLLSHGFSELRWVDRSHLLALKS